MLNRLSVVAIFIITIPLCLMVIALESFAILLCVPGVLTWIFTVVNVGVWLDTKLLAWWWWTIENMQELVNSCLSE